ncbi:hypothetical protein ABPG75_007296 [Micractinium tetrahymenae]
MGLRLLVALLPLLGALRLPRAFAQAADAATGGAVAAAPTLNVSVGLLGADNWPFSGYQQGASGQMELQGFEVVLMQALCQAANLKCTPVVLSTLEERLDAVSNDSLTLSISSLSVTPARAAVVQFIKRVHGFWGLATAVESLPYYYSTGVALFGDTSKQGLEIFGSGSQPGGQTAATGWRGAFGGSFPLGQTLCFVQGYYAVPFVLADFGGQLKVDLSPTLEEAAAKVKSGKCAALAYDSATPASVVGLPLLNAPQVYVAPYGIALQQQAANSELEARLSWAMTGLMSQGNDSVILQLEQQWLVPFGVGPSSALHSVVDAISFFGPAEAAGPGKVPATYSIFGSSPGGRRLLHGRSQR